jgi:hypothetical protein
MVTMLREKGYTVAVAKTRLENIQEVRRRRSRVCRVYLRASCAARGGARAPLSRLWSPHYMLRPAAISRTTAALGIPHSRIFPASPPTHSPLHTRRSPPRLTPSSRRTW